MFNHTLQVVPLDEAIAIVELLDDEIARLKGNNLLSDFPSKNQIDSCLVCDGDFNNPMQKQLGVCEKCLSNASTKPPTNNQSPE